MLPAFRTPRHRGGGCWPSACPARGSPLSMPLLRSTVDVLPALAGMITGSAYLHPDALAAGCPSTDS